MSWTMSCLVQFLFILNEKNIWKIDRLSLCHSTARGNGQCTHKISTALKCPLIRVSITPHQTHVLTHVVLKHVFKSCV